MQEIPTSTHFEIVQGSGVCSEMFRVQVAICKFLRKKKLGLPKLSILIVSAILIQEFPDTHLFVFFRSSFCRVAGV